jgi:hypothetical protein
MSRNNRVAVALWLLAAAAAFAIAAGWADSTRTAMIAPWALVAFFWGVALLSVLVHYLSQVVSDLRV